VRGLSRILAACVVAVGMPVAAHAADMPQVSVDGAVSRPGSAVYPADARLSAAALAAGVTEDAYILGAAWLRPGLRRDQLRLRAGLVYELGAIRRQAMAAGKDDLSIGAAAFQGWLSGLPITGRRTLAALDPARLEVTPADDWPVQDGDRLHYPRRPQDIRVVGAVGKPCRLPQVAFRDARRYLDDCPVSAAADPDTIFVVQPDGAVFPQNIALWNRDAPRPLAPGAWIYVAFDRKAIAGAADEDFNREVAEFLATQVLDDEGVRQ
jgi:hypothetical protein